jgi:hypothetical protein
MCIPPLAMSASSANRQQNAIGKQWMIITIASKFSDEREISMPEWSKDQA